jgi:hypothetical protein
LLFPETRLVSRDRLGEVLIPPDSGKRTGERPGWTGGRYSFMRRVLAPDLGRETYRKRQQSIEPVYGHTKHNARSTASTTAADSPCERSGDQ